MIRLDRDSGPEAVEGARLPGATVSAWYMACGRGTFPLCTTLSASHSFSSYLSCNFPLAACLVQRLMCLCNATLAHYPLIHFRTSSPPDPSCPFWLLQPYRSFAHRWLWSSLPGTQISKSNADQITAIIMNAKQGLCMTSRYPRAVKNLKSSNISISTWF